MFSRPFNPFDFLLWLRHGLWLGCAYYVWWHWTYSPSKHFYYGDRYRPVSRWVLGFLGLD